MCEEGVLRETMEIHDSPTAWSRRHHDDDVFFILIITCPFTALLKGHIPSHFKQMDSSLGLVFIKT